MHQTVKSIIGVLVSLVQSDSLGFFTLGLLRAWAWQSSLCHMQVGRPSLRIIDFPLLIFNMWPEYHLLYKYPPHSMQIVAVTVLKQTIQEARIINHFAYKP